MQENKINRIGLIGLGLVGTELAKLLIAKGYEITGFDIDADRCKILKEHKVKIASCLKEVADEADCLILSLPDSSVVRQVITGSEGVLQSKGLPDYCIDTTTGDPDEIVEIAEKCAKAGMSFLDAGISGSSRQIADREGVFMVGGEQKAFKACEQILNIFSDKIFYLGMSASGSRAKLASNLILGLNRLVLAEGLVFAEKLGLETEAFLELMKNSPAYSTAMDSKGPKMIRGDFDPESRIRQHYKDVEIILKYAHKAGQDLPLSKIHLEVMEKAITAGDGDLDNAAVIRELRRRCGDETD
ncbi:MAG: NAD(P)-dependent oxidoreductase [Planctomycetes bacterium]|nr:NAD(P)-dependent oxidoreductase [Planctomycetota bacterium]